MISLVVSIHGVACYDGFTVCFHGICGKYFVMVFSMEIVVAFCFVLLLKEQTCGTSVLFCFVVKGTECGTVCTSTTCV